MQRDYSFISIGSTRLFRLLLLILAGESIFFLPFVLVRVFRPTFLTVFDLTNLELGMLFSAYGIVAMVSYFFGGPLADRLSPRVLLSAALIVTGLSGFMLVFAPSYHGMLWLYAFWGLTTILLFWAALLKATRILGGDDFQGRAFGLLEAGRGLMAAMVGTIAVGILDFYLPEKGTITLVHQQQAFDKVLLFFSGWVVLVGLLIALFLKTSNHEEIKSQRISWLQLKTIATKSIIWYQAMIIVCAYVGYKVTDDFPLLASDVLGFSDVEAAQVGAWALWLRMITAILAGILADRVGQSSKVISWGFALMCLSGLIISTGLIPAIPFYYLLCLTTSCLGVYAVRGLYFTLVQESHIPLAVSGTSIGIISVVGFTPDVFMGQLMGYLLDENPGVVGHQLVFLTLAVFALIGWFATLRFIAINHKEPQ